MDPPNRLILQVLRLLGKAMPWLGKAIERITDSLLRENQTMEEIIQRRLEPEPDRESKAKRLTESDSQSNPTTEVSAPYESSAAPKSDTRTTNQKSISKSSDDTGMAAQEMALRQIQEDFQDNRERMQTRLERIHTQDAAVFRVMLVFGTISLILILGGAYFLFQEGISVVVVLSELVGLISGAGTVILRRLQQDLREKSDHLERQQEDQTRYLRAIQSALALTGPEREKQLAETAKWLREGLRTAAQQRDKPTRPSPEASR